MRDLGDMIQRVRKKIGDYADTMVADPAIETAMDVAADAVWEGILGHTQAMHILLRFSADDYDTATPLVAEQEDYALPDDCLRLREVQFMSGSQGSNWRTLTRKEKSAVIQRSGNDVLFGSDTEHHGPMYWDDATQPGYIRIWPALKTTSGERIRFRYAAKPAWPEDYGCTFNDPDGDGVKEHNLPDRVAEAIEWGAALELASDKVGASLNYELALNSYHRAMRSLVNTARETKPVRQYIKRVQR